MIASSLGLFLIGGVYQTFQITRQSARFLQAEAEMQENARFAFSLLSNSLKKAGNFGCKSTKLQSSSSLLKISHEQLNPALFVQGWEAKSSHYGDVYHAKANSSISNITTKHWFDSTGLHKNKGIKSKKDSDILKIWYTKPNRASLTTVNNNELKFTPIDLEQGNIIAINDCQNIQLAQVCACEDADCEGLDSEVKLQSCNQISNLKHIKTETAEVAILEQAIFFVSKRASNKKNYKKNMPALYVRHLGKGAKPTPKQEILEGVESLQVEYGEDTDANGSANTYVSADLVRNWKNIVSLKLGLLLRSSNNHVITSPQQLVFNGATIAVNDDDRYLRRVFSTTIAIRN
jgi:type IV pilus assembly protein PilW